MALVFMNSMRFSEATDVTSVSTVFAQCCANVYALFQEMDTSGQWK